MKNKLIKILLILMMAVSVLTVNTEQIFAENTPGLLINCDEGRLELAFSPNEEDGPMLKWFPYSDKSDRGSTVYDIEGISVDVYNECNGSGEIAKSYAQITLLDDVELKTSNINHLFIETCMPLIIKSEVGEHHILTLDLNEEYEYLPEEDTHYDITGIHTIGDLVIQDVEIDFCSNLQNTDCIKYEDDFYAIEIEGYEEKDKMILTTNIDPQSSNLEILDSSLFVWGTGFVNDGVEGDVYIDNSSIIMETKYPDEYHIDYRQSEDGFIYTKDGTITITNESSVYLTANVPEQAKNEASAPYIEMPMIAAENIVIEEQSTLDISEPNYHYLSAIQTANLRVDDSYINIEGFLYSLYYYSRSKTPGKKVTSVTPGFYFINADYKMESLLANIMMMPKAEPYPILSFSEDKYSKHIDFMRVIGDSNTAQEYDLPPSVSSIVLSNPSMLSIDEDEYESVKASLESSASQEPEYDQDFDPNDIKIYRAVQFTSKNQLKPIDDIRLTIINTNDSVVNYLSDGSTEENNPIDAFNVTYTENTGFTVEVLQDYTFTKKSGDIFSCFFMCRNADLNIIGDKKLTFNIEHTATTQQESIRILNEQCIRIMPAHDLFVSGTESGSLKMEINESGVKNGSSINLSMFSDEFAKNPGEEIPPINDFFLNKVDITSNSFSPVIRFDNHNAYITNSTITYNYVSPTAFSNEDRYLGVFLLKNNILFEKSKIIINGNESMYSDPKEASKPINLGFEISGKLTFKECETVSIKGFDVGIAAIDFESIKSSFDIEANRGGIVAMKTCSIELSEDSNFKVSSKLTPDISNNIYPALYTTQDKSTIFKLPEGVDIYDAAGNKIDLSKLDGATSIVVKTSEVDPKPTPTPTPTPSPDNHSSKSYYVPKTGIY